MRYIVLAVCCFVVLFLFFMEKKRLGVFIEYLAVFWFKIALAVIILFIGNIILNSYGFIVPINLFSVLTLAILGFPGAVCIGFLLFMN